MTTEQLIAMLAVISSMLGIIATVFVSVYSLRQQSGQEIERTKLTHEWEAKQSEVQRKWAVEDRNVARNWNATDRQLEQSKRSLEEHQKRVDLFIRTEIALLTRLASINPGRPLGEGVGQKIEDDSFQVLLMASEVYFDANAIGPKTLDAVQELLTITQEFAKARPWEGNFEDSAVKMRNKAIVAAAALMRKMEAEIAEQLIVADWNQPRPE